MFIVSYHQVHVIFCFQSIYGPIFQFILQKAIRWPQTKQSWQSNSPKVNADNRSHWPRQPFGCYRKKPCVRSTLWSGDRTIWHKIISSGNDLLPGPSRWYFLQQYMVYSLRAQIVCPACSDSSCVWCDRTHDALISTSTWLSLLYFLLFIYFVFVFLFFYH